MAKEQVLKFFKNGDRRYIVIDNPTPEMDVKLNALFSDVITDLSSILQPELATEAEVAATEAEAEISAIESTAPITNSVSSNKSDAISWNISETDSKEEVPWWEQ